MAAETGNPLSLLSSITDLFTAERASPPTGPIGSWLTPGPLYVDAFGSKRAPTPIQLVETYKSLIYACVQINANAVCKVPLRLYADASKGGQPRSACQPRQVTRSTYTRLNQLGYLRSLSGNVRDIQEVTEHPILDCIDEPDPEGYYDRQSLISLICRYVDVVGAAYLLKDGPSSGPPSWLWPLGSQYMTVIPAANSPLIRGYTYFAETYDFDEVLRFRLTPSLRDPYKGGYSPSYAAIEYAGLEDSWVSIQTSVLTAGPRPTMIVSAKDPTMAPGESERQRFEQSLTVNNARGNAGRWLVTNGSWEFQPATLPPSDLAGMDVAKYNLERMANIFGIPVPYMSGETNLANLQAAREQHAANAVEPRCKMIAAVFTRLVKQYDPRLFFAFDSAVPEDEEREAKITQIRLSTGQITINQANEEGQWEPVPWGDEPWLPGTVKQPTMLTEAHAMGLETAQAGVGLEAKALEQKKDAGTDRPSQSGGGGNARSGSGVVDQGLPSLDTGRLENVLAAFERELGL